MKALAFVVGMLGLVLAAPGLLLLDLGEWLKERARRAADRRAGWSRPEEGEPMTPIVSGHYFEHVGGDLAAWTCRDCGGRVTNLSPEGALQPSSVYEGEPVCHAPPRPWRAALVRMLRVLECSRATPSWMAKHARPIDVEIAAAADQARALLGWPPGEGFGRPWPGVGEEAWEVNAAPPKEMR